MTKLLILIPALMLLAGCYDGILGEPATITAKVFELKGHGTYYRLDLSNGHVCYVPPFVYEKVKAGDTFTPTRENCN